MYKSLLKCLCYFFIVVAAVFIVLAVDPERYEFLQWLLKLKWYVWFFVILIFSFIVIFSFFLLTFFAVLASSRLKAAITPAPDLQLNTDQSKLSDQFLQNGFTRSSPPVLVMENTEQLLIPFIYKDNEIRGVICSSRSLTKQINSLVIESSFTDDTGDLGTSSNPASGYITMNPAAFRQIIQSADVKTLLVHHVSAVRFLKDNGIKFSKFEPGKFINYVESDYPKTKQRLRKNLFKASFCFFLRAYLRINRYMGPISKQKKVKKQISFVQLKQTSPLNFIH
ncbi:MAG: hypothetical protein ACYSRQ_05015 [Planctomycetota bacterium]|jgi:hypothetical protein